MNEKETNISTTENLETSTLPQEVQGLLKMLDATTLEDAMQTIVTYMQPRDADFFMNIVINEGLDALKWAADFNLGFYGIDPNKK